MKTFNKDDVYSWSNAGYAKAYIGKEGYFGDSLSELDTQVRGAFISILTAVYDDDTDKVSQPFGNSDDEIWGLFLPADKVKEEPKKYRPFRDIAEFEGTLGLVVGSRIVYRLKCNPRVEINGLFSGYLTSSIEGSKDNILLSGFTHPIDLEQAYEGIERLAPEGLWLPFGVEED